MSAWLFTILRNHFFSDYRKRRREVEDPHASYEEALISPPDQIGNIEICELRNALDLLPFEQRESLILVAASGFSYEEAAQICGCAVGTVKSRVNRARNRLAEILSVEGSEESRPAYALDCVGESRRVPSPNPTAQSERGGVLDRLCGTLTQPSDDSKQAAETVIMGRETYSARAAAREGSRECDARS